MYIWLPAVVFLAVAGGFYLVLRPGKTVADEPKVAVVTEKQTEVSAVKSKDQRVVSRRQGNPVQVHVAAEGAKEEPGVASVLDRSVGGIRLATFHEVQAGTVLSIRPINADAMVPWVEVEVRSCTVSKEMPGQFEVGCQYVKSPPYSIQLLFG
jgi:hypothetical protein